MQAIYVDKFVTNYDDLAIRKIPKPRPKEGEVIVQIVAAGVNFVDLLYVRLDQIWWIIYTIPRVHHSVLQIQILITSHSAAANTKIIVSWSGPHLPLDLNSLAL